MTASKKTASTGQLKSMSFEYEDFLNIKDLELNQLSIFVGANGTGKTIIMIHAWIFGFLSQMYVASGKKGKMIAMASETFERCFDNLEWSGTCSGTFESGAKINITLEKGKVVMATAENYESIDDTIGVVYMSTTLRKFDALVTYLKMRNLAAKTTSSTLTENQLSEILKNYKLYDVMYCEKLINSLPVELPENIRKILKESYDFSDDIKSIDVDLVKNDFIATMENGTTKSICSYGAGHQAILNMMIANLL